jgi:hypothetical protein
MIVVGIDMSSKYLSSCLQIAYEATGAERGLALNSDGDVVDQVNIDAALLQEAKFVELYKHCIAEAGDKGEPLITNSAITDPSQVPNTNTVLKNMRVIIVIPVKGLGSIYLDDTIRHGVVRREIVEALSKAFQAVPESDQETVSAEKLKEIYEELLQKV